MLDGYGDLYTEPTTHHFRSERDYVGQGINPAYEQALADRSDLIEFDPILPELGPTEQGVQDAYDATPDYIRASGDPTYRHSLINTLIHLSAPARKAARAGQMTNATGMTYAESWAESGAPGGMDEW